MGIEHYYACPVCGEVTKPAQGICTTEDCPVESYQPHLVDRQRKPSRAKLLEERGESDE